MLEVAEELYLEKINLFKTITLFGRTVAETVEDLGSNISSQMKSKANNFE